MAKEPLKNKEIVIDHDWNAEYQKCSRLFQSLNKKCLKDAKMTDCHHHAIISTWECNDKVKSEKTHHEILAEKARNQQLKAENQANLAAKARKQAETEFKTV